MKNLVFGSFIMVALTACAPDAERTREARPAGQNVQIVSGLMDAFNDHDPDKMREYWHPDIQWVEIVGEQATVITSDAETLHRELVAYFESYPSVKSSLSAIAQNGAFVSAIETPVWSEGGERKSQSSLVVYEIAGGAVRRFWYFPTQ